MDNIRLFIAAYTLPLFLLLNGCISKHPDIGANYKDRSATLYLNLDIPGHAPESRAMSIANESRVDSDNIHILVFEEVGQKEVFRYRATITESTPQQITLEVPVSQNQERYSFVVIANTDVPYIADGTPKDEALNSFVFDCAGKWSTSDDSFTPIPMWGEHKPLVIRNNKSIDISMYRALARVDIGLLFKFNNPDPSNGSSYPDKDNDKESVWGLSNFKIKDIRIYRTLDKAYTASSVGNMIAGTIVTPNIPASAKYNSGSGNSLDDTASADKDPLVFTLSAGGDSYIREIYIPESTPIDANSSSDNVHCLVIGGYYGENNNTDITYYRADFALYNNGKVSAYLPLLRNHRYIFDIRNVRSSGYKEPDQALNSITSNITLDVTEWNELPFDYHLQGSYFYSIDSRETVLDARSTEGTAEISQTISYRTNLDPNPATNPFSYKWDSSGNTSNDNFDIIFDYSSNTITIKAKNHNEGIGAEPLQDRIYINIGNYRFTIDVMQKAINAPYTPDCSGITVHGVYRADFALNHTNYISAKITSSTTLSGLDYDIRTVEKNGIYFAAQGTFDADGKYINSVYEYDMKLIGYGTLRSENQSNMLTSFDIVINFNSITPAVCSAEIVL